MSQCRLVDPKPSKVGPMKQCTVYLHADATKQLNSRNTAVPPRVSLPLQSHMHSRSPILAFHSLRTAPEHRPFIFTVVLDGRARASGCLNLLSNVDCVCTNHSKFCTCRGSLTSAPSGASPRHSAFRRKCYDCTARGCGAKIMDIVSAAVEKCECVCVCLQSAHITSSVWAQMCTLMCINLYALRAHV